MRKIRNITITLLIGAIMMPLIGTLLTVISQSLYKSEQYQYGLLQIIVMGVYNLPFVLVSVLTFTLGSTIYKKGKSKAATVLYVLSVISSITSVVVMTFWGLGLLA
jgi:hypothetical protein